LPKLLLLGEEGILVIIILDQEATHNSVTKLTTLIKSELLLMIDLNPTQSIVSYILSGGVKIKSKTKQIPDSNVVLND
jgi:hypothetical protein